MKEQDKDTQTKELSTKQPLFIDGVSNRLFDGIEMPTVDAEYFIGCDTYDDDMYCYILARKVGDVTEILLGKRQRINGKIDKDQFENDVNKLAELFNATVNGC